MTRIVNLSGPDLHLEELLTSSDPGDEIVLALDKKPELAFTSLLPVPKERIPDLEHGKIWISDDFDDPLPDEFWMGTE